MKKIFLTAAIALFTTISFSQKKNVTSAAMAYQDSQKNAQDMPQSIKDLLEAKSYVDLALAHPDTKEDPKAWMYKGKIYLELSLKMAMVEDKSAFAGLDAEKMAAEGFEALKYSKKVDTKEQYTDDVNDYAGAYRAQFSNMGITAFTEKKYDLAMAGLIGGAEFGELMGLKDSNFYFYGGLAAMEIKDYKVAEEAFKNCVEWNFNTGESVGFYSAALIANGKEAEAEAMLKKAVIDYPNNVDVLIHMANFYIDKKDNAQAVSVIESAIKLAPTSAALVFNAAQLYESMEKYDEAEAAFLKTLELDPKYSSAKFSLGVFYFNRGADINNTANDLPFGDPKYDAMIAESKAIWSEKSLKYLEAASADEPNDVTILEALKTVYGKLSMTDKFLEVKKRIAELEG